MVQFSDERLKSKSWLTHLPNKLTLGRIATIPILLLLYPLSKSVGIICALLFAFAAMTDMLDGWIARRYEGVTTIGALLDPIADKMLMAASLMLLASSNVLPVFFTGILVCRDIGINGLRLLAMEQKIDIKVSIFGKLKTVAESVGIFCLFIDRPLFQIPFRDIGSIAIWIALILSLYSAWQYGATYWDQAKNLESLAKQ